MADAIINRALRGVVIRTFRPYAVPSRRFLTALSLGSRPSALVKYLRTAALSAVVLGASIGTCQAEETDACGAVLCLAGEMMGGSGGSACVSYIEKYFSIVDYHNGHMDLSATPKDRLSFLNQCNTQGDTTKQSVNNQYGTSSGL